MNVLDFLEKGAAAPLKPVYLFCPGKAPRAKAPTFEPLLADRAAEALVNAAIDPSARDMGLTTYYADETDARDVVNEAQTLPFLAERRVVLVRQAHRYEAESAAEYLVPYIQSPNDMTVLILIADKVDKRTKFYKACNKAGAVMECPALNERDAMTWLRTEAKALGRSIENGAVRELISRAGARLSDVHNALELVLNYLGETGGAITEEAVRDACSDVAEEIIWSLTDAIAQSRTGDALASLRKLIEMGKHPDEIIGTINWLLKSAYLVALNNNDPALSRFVADKVRPLAKELGVRRLRRAFALCTDAQFTMRSTGANPELTIELLVLKLAAPRGRAA